MKLLEAMTQTPSIAGREDRLRNLILKHAGGLFDQTRVDSLGSLICHRKPRNPRTHRKKPKRIMIAAHMDQIGFMVHHIDSKGFLRVQSVGGFDPRNLFSRLVTVCTDVHNTKGDLPGVMNPGGKPVHIASEEDRKRVPEISDLVIDLGLEVKEVTPKVHIGDMVVIRAPFMEVGKTIVGQCLDNRVACWLAIRALEHVQQHDCEIYVVFTAQEEVGCRGAGPAADSIQPDIAIALDTTLCVDTPGVDETQSVTLQGSGAGLMVMDGRTIADLGLIEEFEKIAKSKKIKAQRTILARGGTDASTIQSKGSGYRVMSLVCPTRYIHTVTEMIHLDDLYATRDLLAAFLSTTS